MIEIPGVVCLEIQKSPLELVIGRLRKSLQKVVEPKLSDTQETKKLSSVEETDSDSARSDQSEVANLSTNEESDEGMIDAGQHIFIADMHRT